MGLNKLCDFIWIYKHGMLRIIAAEKIFFLNYEKKKTVLTSGVQVTK